MANLSIIIGGVTLPLDRIDQLVELIEPIESSNITLGGKLYTDFTTRRQAYRVHLPFLCEADYNALRDVFNDQYINEAFTTIEIPYYLINTYGKLELNDKNIRRDGDRIEDVDIVVRLESAVS